MPGHVSPDDLEQYVIGALDAASASWVEAHAARCEACAKALASEAQLELSMFEVAALPAALGGARQRRARIAATLTGLTALAAGVLWLFSVERSPPENGHPRIVRCADTRSAAECIAQAQFDGVLTIGPDSQLVVPRYEEEVRP